MNRVSKFISTAWKSLIWNKLTASNAVLFGAIVALAYAFDGGSGATPKVKVWVEGATSFNMPFQISLGMSVLLFLNIIGLGIIVSTTMQYAKNTKQIFYAKYTAFMFFISILSCVLVLTCPTVPGVGFRVTLFGFIGTQAMLFGMLDSVLTYCYSFELKKADLSA